MKSLIEQAQQGVEYDTIKRAWEKIGQPTSPEALYDLLLRILKDKQKVADAFHTIGIKFETTEHKAAKILDKKVAKQIYNYTRQLSPDRIRELIQIVNAGKLSEPQGRQLLQQQGQ